MKDTKNHHLRKTRVLGMRLLGLLLCCALFLTGCTSVQENLEEQEKSWQEQPTAAQEPKEPVSMPTPYVYTFQPHVIAREFLQIYGEEVKEEFFRFCDALLNMEASFPCPSRERFYQLLAISNSCFPLAQELIDKEKTTLSNGVCHLAYRYEEEELAGHIEAFQRKVSDTISAAIPYEAPGFVQAMALFTAVARKDTYDETHTLEDALKTRSYRAIMEDRGICQEIAGEYIYYLLQVGINAITCSSLNEDQSEAHEWVLVQLDGEYYHMDPTAAISYPDSLYFFGMDDIQREYYGNFPMGQYTYADSDQLPREAYAVTSRRFEKLWLAETYKIDYEEQSILVTEIRTGDQHRLAFSDFAK